MDIERAIEIDAAPERVWDVMTDVQRWPALDTGRYFEWQNVAPGVTSVAGHRIEAVRTEATKVTLTFGWTGWLAAVIRIGYGRLARRYVQTEAESLKRRCDGQR